MDGAWAKFTEKRLEYVARDFENKHWFAVVESVSLLKHYRPQMPLDDRTSFAYAEALFQLNRHQEARAEFETLAQAYPTSSFLPQARERITELQSDRSATSPTERPQTELEGDFNKP